MKNNVLLSALLMISLINIGCEERVVVPVSDEDELKRFITDSDDGREIFRIDSLFDSIEYTVTFDTAVYRDVLLDLDRDITVAIAGPAQIGNLGSYKEALVTVTDSYRIRTSRIVGTQTTSRDSTRTLTRYGYFLKLEDDSFPYLGWKLYGVNMVGTIQLPVSIEIRAVDNNPIFYGDLRSLTSSAVSFNFKYIKLENIPTLEKGETILLNANGLVVNPIYNFIGYESNSGQVLTTMDRVSGTDYIDTVIVPSNPTRLWNLIIIQTFTESPPTGKLLKAWCVPYRVNFN